MRKVAGPVGVGGCEFADPDDEEEQEINDVFRRREDSAAARAAGEESFVTCTAGKVDDGPEVFEWCAN